MAAPLRKKWDAEKWDAKTRDMSHSRCCTTGRSLHGSLSATLSLSLSLSLNMTCIPHITCCMCVSTLCPTVSPAAHLLHHRIVLITFWPRTASPRPSRRIFYCAKTGILVIIPCSTSIHPAPIGRGPAPGLWSVHISRKKISSPQGLRPLKGAEAARAEAPPLVYSIHTLPRCTHVFFIVSRVSFHSGPRLDH
jgi:hypothetical protein